MARWRWWLHLLIIGGYPLLVAAVSFGRPQERGAVLTGDARGLMIISLLELLFFGLVFGAGLFASRAGKSELWLSWRGGWRPVGLGFLYSLGIRIAAAATFVLVMAIIASVMVSTGQATAESIVAYVEQNKPNVESVIDVASLKSDPAYFWLSLTLVSFVVAGLREELWRSASLAGLRNLWPTMFGSGRGQIWAVLVTATVFGLGHLQQGVIGMVMTALVGVCLGGVMIRHRSVWPAVFAHGFFDAASIAMLPLVMKHAH